MALFICLLMALPYYILIAQYMIVFFYGQDTEGTQSFIKYMNKKKIKNDVLRKRLFRLSDEEVFYQLGGYRWFV